MEHYDQLKNKLAEITVIIPVGGKATRAQAITNDKFPKHLISISHEETVLGTICHQLQNIGFRSFLFCTGYHSAQIVKYVNEVLGKVDQNVTYRFSDESTPLGPDGAVLNAIKGHAITGDILIIPGDTLLPWNEVAEMCSWHTEQLSDGITLGVTRKNSEHEISGGVFVIDKHTNKLIDYYSHSINPPIEKGGLEYYRSAAVTVATAGYFAHLCDLYSTQHTLDEQLNFRHTILPWALKTDVFSILTYEIEGHMLDVGTPSNIRHAQENHQQYM